ncbi:hypothetical protein PI124_g13105 [Phytophthora idaei]|nr:hypothetical protein PI125_g12666 [Phytophthora idaei]KAG3150172.1 hypothetical protein PI126_g11631 [Phytophthora idaei]KAG3242054.1 hypothetical protein PI124_g13105 [Phytophthora idaei]
MTSLPHAVVSAVQHAVLHAGSADCTHSSEEACSAVATRATDVLAGMIDATKLELDPVVFEDRPNAVLSTVRIVKAADAYRIVAENTYEL